MLERIKNEYVSDENNRIDSNKMVNINNDNLKAMQEEMGKLKMKFEHSLPNITIVYIVF